MSAETLTKWVIVDPQTVQPIAVRYTDQTIPTQYNITKQNIIIQHNTIIQQFTPLKGSSM
jgi:hypothetical protein